MNSGSEKLWPSVLTGLLLANASTVFGQSPPSLMMPQYGSTPVMSQPSSAGLYSQPYYAPQPQYVQQPQYVPVSPYGMAPTWQQPNQYGAFAPSDSLSSGYVPYIGGQYGAASPTGPCQSAPTPQNQQCYRTSGPTAPREGTNCDQCRPTNGARRWTESECDCPAVPLGASLSAYRNAMRVERYNVSMVLYRYDFADESEHLNAKGRARLGELIALAASNAVALTIEDVPEEPRLAMLRRETVLSELIRRGSPISPERVVIRPAVWPQIRSEESELIQRRLLKQTTNGGPTSIGRATR